MYFAQSSHKAGLAIVLLKKELRRKRKYYTPLEYCQLNAFICYANLLENVVRDWKGGWHWLPSERKMFPPPYTFIYIYLHLFIIIAGSPKSQLSHLWTSLAHHSQVLIRPVPFFKSNYGILNIYSPFIRGERSNTIHKRFSRWPNQKFPDTYAINLKFTYCVRAYLVFIYYATRASWKFRLIHSSTHLIILYYRIYVSGIAQ